MGIALNDTARQSPIGQLHFHLKQLFAGGSVFDPCYQVTLAKFLQWENTQLERHEFFPGEIFAMVGGTSRHNRVIVNLARRIDAHFDCTACRLHAENMKVQLAPSKPRFCSHIANPRPGVAVRSGLQEHRPFKSARKHVRQIIRLEQAIEGEYSWAGDKSARQPTRAHVHSGAIHGGSNKVVN